MLTVSLIYSERVEYLLCVKNWVYCRKQANLVPFQPPEAWSLEGKVALNTNSAGD